MSPTWSFRAMSSTDCPHGCAFSWRCSFPFVQGSRSCLPAPGWAWQPPSDFWWRRTWAVCWRSGAASLGWIFATGSGFAYQYLVEGREKRQVRGLFSRYLSKDVYEQVLANPALAELGG